MTDLKKLTGKLPKTIELKKDYAVLIDQLVLPGSLRFVKIKTYQQMIKAIYDLQVRGAPAIGAAGASAVYLAASAYRKNDLAGFKKYLAKTGQEIIKTRPTAVNLAWAVKKVLAESDGQTVAAIKSNIYNSAQAIIAADVKNNIALGQYGAALIKNHDRIETHCNAGSLATVWFGTALAPIFTAFCAGKKIKVLIDETRPMLQGSRLTAWELQRAGIDYKINIDSANGYLMAHGLVDKVIVGADRVAANGDTANKIGTYPLALMAHEHHIPFYVAVVISSIDFNCPTGQDIPIEERNPAEVIDNILYWKKPVAPKGAKAFNPVFDVTPAKYVTGYITERGVFKANELKKLQ